MPVITRPKKVLHAPYQTLSERDKEATRGKHRYKNMTILFHSVQHPGKLPPFKKRFSRHLNSVAGCWWWSED